MSLLVGPIPPIVVVVVGGGGGKAFLYMECAVYVESTVDVNDDKNRIHIGILNRMNGNHRTFSNFDSCNLASSICLFCYIMYYNVWPVRTVRRGIT